MRRKTEFARRIFEIPASGARRGRAAVPASLKVIEEVRGKYACACGGALKTAPKPPPPIEKGLAGASLLAPLYERLKARLLATPVVQTDDTPVAVLDPELPKTRTGRIRTYVGGGATVYDYTPTRQREGPAGCG